MLRVARELFRIWVVLSLGWVLGCLWFLDFSCFFKFSSGPWCDWWVLSPLASSDYVRVLAITFGIPAFVLALGSALVWALKGFRD